MARDLHKEPFDEGTKVKLLIFQDYLRAWLSICFQLPWIRNINIFDFFAGPGQDTAGFKGTPLIILDELAHYQDKLANPDLSVNLYFNEYDEAKFNKLQKTVNAELEESGESWKIELDCLDFSVALAKKKGTMTLPGCMNLLFLDQSGVMHSNESIFTTIINLKRTDFLFFISSSTIYRFNELPSIRQYIDMEVDPAVQYHQIHREVLKYYKTLIPTDKEYYLAPFSLKKNSGLYGLVFGSGNPLGIEKFLETSWRIDPERGEANFDIDSDFIDPRQPDLFNRKPKKIDLFERELKDGILSRQLRSDKDIYIFSITNGFLKKHALNAIKQLESEGLITKKSLNLSNTVCKQKAVLTDIELI